MSTTKGLLYNLCSLANNTKQAQCKQFLLRLSTRRIKWNVYNIPQQTKWSWSIHSSYSREVPVYSQHWYGLVPRSPKTTKLHVTRLWFTHTDRFKSPNNWLQKYCQLTYQTIWSKHIIWNGSICVKHVCEYRQ